MDLSDFKTSRFTVTNDDNTIFLSKQLKEKLFKPSQPQTAEVPVQTPFSVKSTQTVPPLADTDTLPNDVPKMPSNTVPLEEERMRYAESISSEMSKSEAFYGNTILALRDAYEYKLELQRAEWRSRMKELEELNDRLMKQKSTELAKGVSHLEKKYFANRTGYAESPCYSAECAVKECYGQNDKRSLLCAEKVKAFAECVRLAGLDIVKGKQ